VPVVLETLRAGGWAEVASRVTDGDGRVADLATEAAPGTYRLRFDVSSYYGARDVKTFFPFVEIAFLVTDDEHHHVPLLVSPFGYSTYRGS